MDDDDATAPLADRTTGALGTPGEQAGDRIDRYELLEQIGVGGMGVVWRARQTEPMTREVALKVIKLGMDTREVVRRFEAERQALARMDHPHIAKVLDGGTTHSGRPYFVMELVRGEPITDHCARAKLGLEARLELFVAVCDGIQHAHQKGLIHRDIKPSNVLVEERVGRAEPRVIDFGIAKATGAEVTQGTLLTQHAQILGTPDYMAPEQADSGGLDIDTRADVYSLGALLYELLTGTRPFDLRAVLARGFDELLRTIREVDPERPSTRVSAAAVSGQTHATQMRADPRSLARGLSRDLDWIVMKALEKDRERRYDSASELAADVQRFLDREPVIAAPPNALYRLRKLVQRRRKSVVAAAALVLALAAGAVGTGLGLWKAVQANAALDESLTALGDSLAEEGRQRQLAEESERRARQAEAQALERAGELEDVVGFQTAQLSDLDPARMGALLRADLLQAVPDAQRAKLETDLAGVNFTDLALHSLEANLFGDTIETIEARFQEQPLVRARLLDTMARSLRDLGLIQAAVEPQARALALYREQLGDGHEDTLGAISSAANLRADLGDAAGAVELYSEALAGRRRLLGDEHPDTLGAIGSLASTQFLNGDYAAVEALYQEALDTGRRVFGPDDPETLRALNNMAGFLRDMGRYDEAGPLYAEVLAGRRRVLGDDHRDTIVTMLSASSYHRRRGQFAQAEALILEALGARRRALGEQHPDTLMAFSIWATVLGASERDEEALMIEREVLAARRRLLSPEHPDTLSSLGNVAVSLIKLGRLDEAEPLLLEVLDSRRRLLGRGHPDTLTTTHNLGSLYQKQGRPREGEALLHESLLGRWRHFGQQSSKADSTQVWLQRALRDLCHAAEDAGAGLELAEARAHRGAFELASGQLDDAEQHLRQALEFFAATLPETDARLWHTRGDLGAVLADRGPDAEAQQLLEQAAAWLVANTAASGQRPDAHGDVDPTTNASEVQRLIDIYSTWHAARPDGGYADSAELWRARLEVWQG